MHTTLTLLVALGLALGVGVGILYVPAYRDQLDLMMWEIPLAILAGNVVLGALFGRRAWLRGAGPFLLAVLTIVPLTLAHGRVVAEDVSKDPTSHNLLGLEYALLQHEADRWAEPRPGRNRASGIGNQGSEGAARGGAARGHGGRADGPLLRSHSASFPGARENGSCARESPMATILTRARRVHKRDEYAPGWRAYNRLSGNVWAVEPKRLFAERTRPWQAVGRPTRFAPIAPCTWICSNVASST
jgi:hypothetical protein